MALLPDEELVKIADLHPPNCDCCHEMCGEMARELLDARKQIAALKESYHDGWNQFQAERERVELLLARVRGFLENWRDGLIF